MTNDYFNNNTEGCEKLKSENFSCCLKKKVKTGRKEEREGGAKPFVRGVERAKERRGGGARRRRPPSGGAQRPAKGALAEEGARAGGVSEKAAVPKRLGQFFGKGGQLR